MSLLIKTAMKISSFHVTAGVEMTNNNNLLIIINGAGTVSKARHLLHQGAWSGRSKGPGYGRPLFSKQKVLSSSAAGLTTSVLQFCPCMKRTGVTDNLQDRKASAHSTGTWWLWCIKPFYCEKTHLMASSIWGGCWGVKNLCFSVLSYRRRPFFLHFGYWLGN